MSWLLFLPTYELADQLLAERDQPIRADIKVSHDWEAAPRISDGDPLLPDPDPPIKEQADG